MELSTVTAHRPGPISPILKPEENVGFLLNNSWNFYKCVMLEPIQPAQVTLQDLGAIVAGASSANTQATGVSFDVGRLGQIRIAVLDDIRLRVFESSAIAKFVNLSGHTQISLASRYLDPDASLTEMFVFENQHLPFFTVVNPLGVNLASSRIIVWGIQYVLAPLVKQPERATKVIATGITA